MATLNHETIARCARILAYARQTGEPVPDLPPEAAPASEDEAFAIQREVLEIGGDAIGGWKCAAPPGRPQSGACLGRSGFLTSPAQLKFRADRDMGIEAEIAVRLAHDLPGRADGRPYTRDDIVDAIGAVFPALELVQSRYTDMRAVSNLAGLADAISNFGFVQGADVPGWRALDLSRLRVVLSFGDEVKVDQVGGNPSGDPIAPVVWLANRLPGTGRHLKAGEVVTTGSCTGLLFVKPGVPVTATFEGLGTVSLDLVGACPFGFG
jgi:2-keto-4-pentenoate hydratase